MRLIAIGATAVALLGISIPFVWQTSAESVPSATSAAEVPDAAAQRRTRPRLTCFRAVSVIARHFVRVESEKFQGPMRPLPLQILRRIAVRRWSGSHSREGSPVCSSRVWYRVGNSTRK